ncbi:MAG: multicopper oxidase family protein [Hyphomonadaceae bacterium]|nr:multicopper oxidase family protein [Hyphomonadaceae bacterium]
MSRFRVATLTRRSVLSGAAGLACAALLPRTAMAGSSFKLIPKQVKAPLIGQPHPDTVVWAYNDLMPGPPIRVRQGDRLKIAVENQLAEETTVHFHGIRLPNAMDGVPHLTQTPIAPGREFIYEFDVPDAGTYWYHPHQGSAQVGRGLAGALVVEEREPIQVDRDVVWLLQDWRLRPDGQISNDFGNMHDITHSGRIGNTVTINGRVQETFAVRSGERIRLRLINAANARIFGLSFAGHQPRVIAIDGQPVEPHEPSDGTIILAPAMRIDLILDMAAKPGERFQVLDSFYRGLEYRLIDLAYADTPYRERILDTAIALTPNAIPEPDLNRAERHEVAFNGGMMGQMMMRDRGMAGMNMRDMMQKGKVWFINGVAMLGHVMDPMLTLTRGRSYVLAMANETAWWHPIHLHGHVFRVLSRNGAPTRHREWQDTVLMEPREKVEIAFVADNPGDWMFHCHILEHQDGGMMGVIRVT